MTQLTPLPLLSEFIYLFQIYINSKNDEITPLSVSQLFSQGLVNHELEL